MIRIIYFLFLLWVSPLSASDYRPQFTVIYSKDKWVSVNHKWESPVYNLVGWKREDGSLTVDLFDIGKVITATHPRTTSRESGVDWEFEHSFFTIGAKYRHAADGEAYPSLDYTVRISEPGSYTFAYTGGPARSIRQVSRLWQPLVWDERRLPARSFLIPDDHCSIPGCLMESKHRTFGIMADPSQFPYEMPNSTNRKFGVLLRDQNHFVQPAVYSPMPGSHSYFKKGDTHRFKIYLVNEDQELSETFESVARKVCRFRDQRENTLATLNEALDNMTRYALSDRARFDKKHKSFTYPDAKGTVKNVSSLHPLGIALVTDTPEFFHEQAVPIMEYLMSRAKFLFAIDETGLNHSQKPGRNLNGPAMPVSELAALHRISSRKSPVFLEQCKKLYLKDRKLNMDWVEPGRTWQRSLWMYRATGEAGYLADATSKANEYIKRRLKHSPIDFSEAGDGTFFDYMIPAWKDLYELYLDTGDPEHLDAAHRGARRYAQFVWFYPAVPDQEITVNPRGFAPRRGRPEADGLLRVAKETVPAWRVSDQGLMCEGNGTAQRIGVLLATHAPYFLRIAREKDDDFLRDIARAAVIGRYANFPGYHLNTRFSTAQEKPDFPLHDYDLLKPTTSMHYNHILPMINLVIDYLVARAWDLSKGKIDFPGEYAEAYAFLQGRIHGAEGGRFYSETNVVPWMPKGLIKVEDKAINYLSGKGENRLCIALMNTSSREIENTEISINHPGLSLDFTYAKVWKDNQLEDQPIEVKNGKATVSLSPRGITALVIQCGLPPSFHDQFKPASPVEVINIGPSKVGGAKPEGMVFNFGPGLRSFYAFLRSNQGDPGMETARLTLKLDDLAGEITLTDDSFPFEFSFPLDPETKTVEYAIAKE